MLRPITLITGASAGIGAALARVFGAHGHDLVLVARRKAKLDMVAEEITSAGASRPTVLAFDLAASEASEHLAIELVKRELQPEIVVNNAGFGLVGDAAVLDRNEQLAMIDLNVRAVTDLSLRFLDSLVRCRGGLLNVASIAGFMPGPRMAVYHATKADILSFTEALHGELATKGVRVTALCPGPVVTEFQIRAGIDQDYFPEVLTRTSARVAEEAYDGLMRGRRLVVPGFANKVACFLPRILSRSYVLAMAAKIK
jgi:uncharacterized protein